MSDIPYANKNPDLCDPDTLPLPDIALTSNAPQSISGKCDGDDVADYEDPGRKSFVWKTGAG